MKVLAIVVGLVSLLSGCSSVQVAQLDKTLPSTKVIEFYKSKTELLGRPYREVGYLASEKPVNETNYTEELGRLMNAARRIGADALVLNAEENASNDPNFAGLRAIAIVFDKITTINY